MRSSNLNEPNTADLTNLSMQLDDYIAAHQVAALPTQQELDHQAPGQATYRIRGNHTGEAYTVELIHLNAIGNYVFLLRTPQRGDRFGGRQWNGLTVTARTVESAHAKAERKIQKRDALYAKQLEAQAWIQDRNS